MFPKLAQASPILSAAQCGLCAADVRRQERLRERAKLKDDPELAAKLAESRLQPITYRKEGPTLAPAIQVQPMPLSHNPLPRSPLPPPPVCAHLCTSQNCAADSGLMLPHSVFECYSPCLFVTKPVQPAAGP